MFGERDGGQVYMLLLEQCCKHSLEKIPSSGFGADMPFHPLYRKDC